MIPADHPRELDVSRPSVARVYDYMLGGTHNYAVDKDFAAKIISMCPFIPEIARQNRACLRQMVHYLAADCGIKQFLDIGSGIPTVENVHQVAHAIDPTIRVVYVDIENEAIVTAKRLLQDEPHATAVFGDICKPDLVFRDPDTQRLIDLSQPVGLLMMSVLHFVADEKNPRELVRYYLDQLPSGSYFAASHVTMDDVPRELHQTFLRVEKEYGNTSSPSTLRSKQEFTAFFDDLEIVDPGVVYAADWRPVDRVPADNPARPSMWAAVGRKPLTQAP